MKNVNEIAAILRASDEWDENLCRDLCEAADMLEAWESADGETFEAVVEAAAEKLGVEIY